MVLYLVTTRRQSIVFKLRITWHRQKLQNTITQSELTRRSQWISPWRRGVYLDPRLNRGLAWRQKLCKQSPVTKYSESRTQRLCNGWRTQETRSHCRQYSRCCTNNFQAWRDLTQGRHFNHILNSNRYEIVQLFSKRKLFAKIWS